jgi:hypothetical protein
MPIIAKTQECCLIIAASSSVLALTSHGIKPDIIISTDGGNWALKHLYCCTRYQKTLDTAAEKKTERLPLAVNLSAALPSQTKDSPLLIINDNSFWQNIVFHELSIPSVIIPQRGTVTATAVELALLLSNENIYLAGMDFSNNDIRSHIKPYPFDNLFWGQSNRFLPFYSVSFKRSRLLQDGGSMDIYSAWFKDQVTSWPERIYSLSDHKIFRTMIPEPKKMSKNITAIFNVTKTKDNPALFRKRGLDVILSAINNPKYAENIKKELTFLLFSDQVTSHKITNHELETAIKELTNSKVSYE